jgi:hypothetical protein
MLLDAENPLSVIGDANEPFLTWEDFPETGRTWISGAVYLRNLIYNWSRDTIVTAVTHADCNNYLVETTMKYILSTMQRVKRNF